MYFNELNVHTSTVEPSMTPSRKAPDPFGSHDPQFGNH